MDFVTISPKYQIVIPRKVRDYLLLQPGQKVHVFAFADRIELIPLKPIRETRGFLKGIQTDMEREIDRV
ncbi:MAG: AbrB/MazE/SpoVT family DNA-binding domain-containing protein [Chloroflexi bacterium]|nr:AbrB/MazE/SpoVT family DNA-binding domain-containing protein [Chloroflexota bacterium]